MSEIKHEPGTFCWVELMTSDTDAAKQFYGELLGWKFRDDPMPNGGTYIGISIEEGGVGGMFQLTDEMKQMGVPPHWGSYVSVESADDAVARATELGGTVVKPAFDVMDLGRMAVLDDPTGGGFAVWEPKAHVGYSHPPGKIGTVCWNELATNNVDVAGKFYSELFGWKLEVSDMGDMKYTLFNRADGNHAGGMMPMEGDQWKGVPPHWMIYFLVDNCDASVDRAKQLGGEVSMPPTDIPNVGRFAVLSDPQGVPFSIMHGTEPAK